MNTIKVRFVMPQSVYSMKDPYYKFNFKKCKYPKLRNFVFKFLCKHGFLIKEIPKEITGVSYQQYDFDLDKVADLIFRQMNYVQSITGREIKLIAIGTHNFSDLMAEDILQLPNYTGYNRFDQTFGGIPIQTIPWMEGILVIPQD